MACYIDRIRDFKTSFCGCGKRYDKERVTCNASTREKKVWSEREAENARGTTSCTWVKSEPKTCQEFFLAVLPLQVSEFQFIDAYIALSPLILSESEPSHMLLLIHTKIARKGGSETFLDKPCVTVVQILFPFLLLFICPYDMWESLVKSKNKLEP